MRSYSCYYRSDKEIKCRNGAGLLMVAQVMMLVVLVLRLSMLLVMAFVIFGFRLKKGRDIEDWCMLLPLNHRVYIREAHRK